MTPATEDAKRELKLHQWLCDESVDMLDTVKRHMWRIEVERANRYGRIDPIAVKADSIMQGVRKQIAGVLEIRDSLEKLEEENPGRVRFDRGDINSAIAAAQRLKSDRDLYIYATYLGFTIDRGPPPGVQSYVVVHPDGSTETIKPSLGNPKAVPEVGNQKTLAEMDATPEIHKLYPEFDELFTKRNTLVDRLAQLEFRAKGRPGFEKRLDELFEQREKADADLVTIQRKIAKEHPELAYREIPTPTETIDLTKGRMIEILLDPTGRAIPPEAEDLPTSAVEYDRRYTLEELREMAKAKGLSPSGSKKEIAAKLIARRGVEV